MKRFGLFSGINVGLIVAMGVCAVGCAKAVSSEANKTATAAKESKPGHNEPAAVKVKEGAANAPAAKPAANTVDAAPLQGTVYGKGVALTTTTKVSELRANPDAFVGKRVRVEGLVTDVCPMRGCWFNMAGDKVGSSLRFKVKDGVMVFPMSAKGKYAVAEGVVRKIPLNLDQTRRALAHEAEEKGEKFDPASVTKPITLVRLDGVGAVLADKKAN